MNKIQQIYEILNKAYGKQGWWPIINSKTLLCEYGLNAPKNASERFEICIGAVLTQGTQWYPNVVRAIQQLKLGREFTKNELEVIKKAEILKGKISERPKKLTKSEILTQNTSWKNVEKAIIELNKAKVLSVRGILGVRLSRLAKLIRSAGYYNQKAERLKIVAKFFSGKNDVSRDELLEVKGIGPETADSILLYAFRMPYFVVDAYTKRIFSRIGFKFNDYDELQMLFVGGLEKDVKLYNEYHALLVELAKRHCKVKPECKGCPLYKVCKKQL